MATHIEAKYLVQLSLELQRVGFGCFDQHAPRYQRSPTHRTSQERSTKQFLQATFDLNFKRSPHARLSVDDDTMD